MPSRLFICPKYKTVTCSTPIFFTNVAHFRVCQESLIISSCYIACFSLCSIETIRYNLYMNFTCITMKILWSSSNYYASSRYFLMIFYYEVFISNITYPHSRFQKFCQLCWNENSLPFSFSVFLPLQALTFQSIR